jgi:RNA polymerase sigma-70 factor (ECF subfamily)
MNGDVLRSSGMSETVAMAFAPPNTPALEFDALFRSCADDVHAYVAALVRDRTAAEDVTALAFERAYRRRNRYDARKGTPRQWLFAIARNAALDELRRRRRTATLLADPEDASAVVAPAGEDDELAARRASVRAALAGLDPRDRELIAMKFHAGLSLAEIGGVLGISESNAGTRVHRAVTKLRKACA